MALEKLIEISRAVRARTAFDQIGEGLLAVTERAPRLDQPRAHLEIGRALLSGNRGGEDRQREYKLRAREYQSVTN